jgi:hypothetical protein
MKRSTALKIILTHWADYRSDGDREPGDTSLYDLMGETPPDRLCTAFLVYMGKQCPDSDELTPFIDKYGDWMLAVREKWVSIMIGEITMEEVLFDQVIKETWL